MWPLSGISTQLALKKWFERMRIGGCLSQQETFQGLYRSEGEEDKGIWVRGI